jgi:hypothetical protein
MIKSKRRVAIYNMITTFILIATSSGVATYYPAYITHWSQNLSWVLAAFLLLVFLLPVSKEIVGDATAQLPLATVFRKIVSSYVIITVFVVSLFMLMMTVILNANAEEIIGVLRQNLATFNYQQSAYPWILYIFGVAIITLIGYKVNKPKISGTLVGLIPARYLQGFFGAVVDFIGIMGFFIGILCIIGTSAMALAKLLALMLGHPLNYNVDITLMGVTFALIYLPFSPLWTTAITKLQNRNWGLGLTLLVLIVGFAIFLLAIYGAIYLFVQSFSSYFASLEENLPQIILADQLAAIHFSELMWAFGMVSIAIVSGWWLQYVQGYSLRSVMLILLAPYLLVLGIVELLHYTLSVAAPIATLASLRDWGVAAIEWSSRAPQTYLIGLVASAILIMGMRKENNFIKGLFLIMPNLAGRKLSRWKNLIMRNGGFIAISIVFSIFFGLYFEQIMLNIFATMFSFVMVLMLLSLTLYLSTRKLL